MSSVGNEDGWLEGNNSSTSRSVGFEVDLLLGCLVGNEKSWQEGREEGNNDRLPRGINEGFEKGIKDGSEVEGDIVG